MKNIGNNPNQILLISSRADPAGSLIHKEVRRLLEENPYLQERYQHRYFDERLIYLEGSSLVTDADLIIFLSRHASKEPRSVLTVHVTGNYGTAEYGGSSGTLTPAATRMMHALMNRLEEHVPKGYTVTYEATHHGPTSIPVPSCFVEVGSTEKEWTDEVAAAAVAWAVIGAVPDENVVSLAGFGGTHYAQRQTEITLTTRGGFGHLMPTRDLVHLNQKFFDTIIACTGAEAVYVDKKSVSREYLIKIEEYAAAHNLLLMGLSDLKGLKNIPFSEYLKIRQLAEEILPGSSVTIHGLDQGDDLVGVTLPADLVAETAKIDPDGFSKILDTLPVVRLSGKGLAYYPTFITNQENAHHITDELIHLCVLILHRNCNCRFDGDCLIITKNKFDPGKAASLGVPAGPAFGKLMAGEVVLIHGVEVTPEMVMSMTEKRICIPGWGT